MVLPGGGGTHNLLKEKYWKRGLDFSKTVWGSEVRLEYQSNTKLRKYSSGFLSTRASAG